MSSSSQQEPLSTISLDDLTTIDLSSGTLSITGSDYSYSNSMNTITLTAPTYTTINTVSPIDTVTIDTSSFTFNLPVEWVDCLPPLDRIQDMCEQYPGLEIAFRNFQTVYQLVKDDYDNPTPKK